MASFGKITNSLVTGVNENTLALANLNFDFSLVKVQAPEEYSAVGSALGTNRRENAEYGTSHRTARKLGALFEALVPSVPKLVAAYGSRSSEIIKAPGLNPSGSPQSHGAFAAFVGADATSIWAAATSSTTAIGLHLLACLLARSFNDPAQSTSVWAELVSERQREIARSRSQGADLRFADIATINAASQQIPREELRLWDASVRAWLLTADTARKKEHTQLKLILKNITLPVCGGTNLYNDVVHAWKQAMLGFERLLNGQPQSVTDGAIVLALSSWHLYPDLIVLGRQTTNVNFADPLVPPQGLLTVGITMERKEPNTHSGIFWSMALSHYRYYGKPVQIVGRPHDRLTLDEFQLVTLGCLLRTWGAPRNHIKLSAEWFVSLWRLIYPAGDPEDSGEGHSLLWLEILVRPCQRLLAAKDIARKEMSRLVDFGHRRGRTFFSRKALDRPILPWFGLRNRHILRTLSQPDGTASAVEYLRCLAEVGKLDPYHTLIAHTDPTSNRHTYYTAVDSSLAMQDTRSDTNTSGDSTNARTGLRRIMPTPKTHEEISVFGVTRRTKHRTWYDWPNLDSTQVGVAQRGRLRPCNAFLSTDSPRNLGWFPPEGILFQKCFGSEYHENPRLYISSFSSEDEVNFVRDITELRRGKSEPMIDIETSISVFNGDVSLERTLNASLVRWYLGNPRSSYGSAEWDKIRDLMNIENDSMKETRDSILPLVFLQKTYRKLDGATISATVIENSLTLAKWAKVFPKHATTKRIFSCIAMMETGKVNIHPKDFEGVFALSYGNSIFIEYYLLGDTDVYQSDCSVARIIGNVGRPGLSLLIAPAAEPLVRPLSSNYRAVNYEPFDGKIEDNFKGTSLHLLFTSHEFPLEYGDTGIFDHQVFLVESVISVHDAGQWVADIRIPEGPGLDMEGYNRVIDRGSFLQDSCEHDQGDKRGALDYFTTVDTWEEVLDSPPSVGVIRAHQNWPARLALFALLNRSYKYVSQTKPSENEDSPDEWETEESEDGSWGDPGGPQFQKQGYLLRSHVVVCWACVKLSLDGWMAQPANGSIYIIA